MFKNKIILLITFLVFSAFETYSQTTNDEYLFASGGYKKAQELGLGDKQGYSLQPYTGLTDSYFFEKWNSQYFIRLLIRNNDPNDSIAAVILEKGSLSYCIPHPLSDRAMIDRSLADFPEFWNTYNEAILFHFIQTAVWGNWAQERLEDKVILNADFEIANHWEHEPIPDYAKYWGEFLLKTSGREQSYNALAAYPEFDCNESGMVMLRFNISEKGIVTTSNVVNDTFFKGFNGSLKGTNTASKCLQDYSNELIKQFTFMPASKETEAFVLFQFLH